jgi:hypothetical protein
MRSAGAPQWVPTFIGMTASSVCANLAANVIPAQAGTQDTSIETGHVEPVHDALRLAVERGIALEHERVVAGHDTRR